MIDEAGTTGKPARRFKDFRYATLDSWSRRRRVIGKAEWTEGEANPRFIVTSLKKAETNGRFLYEKVYCARGEMENRIKECQVICSPTGPPSPRCARTNSGCGSPRSPMVSGAQSGASASPTRISPTRQAARRSRPHQRSAHQIRARLGLPLRRRMAPRRHPLA